MENHNEQKNKRKNRNKKQRKKQQSGIIDGRVKVEDLKIEEHRKFDKISGRIISSSPRPTNLSRNNLDIPFKKNSGSECEEFQTPNIEYDIKNSDINGNGYEDFNNDYDREWEELATFPDLILDNAIQDEKIKLTEIYENGKNINEIIYKNDNKHDLCNGDIMGNGRILGIIAHQNENENYKNCLKSLINSENEREHQKKKNLKNGEDMNKINSNVYFKEINKEDENSEVENNYLLNGNCNKKPKKKNKKSKKCLIEKHEHLENEIFLKESENNSLLNETMEEKKQNIIEIEIIPLDNQNNDIIKINNESFAKEGKEKFSNNGQSNLSESSQSLLLEKDCKIIQTKLKEEICNANNNGMCIDYVNLFFNDLDNEYNTSAVNETNGALTFSVFEKKEEILFMDSSDLLESRNEKLDKVEKMKYDRKDDETNEFLSIEENLIDETLQVKHVILECIQQPSIPKTMSFKQSATSMTNVTSISEENLSLEIDREHKNLKKQKSNTFKIYTKFMGKFRKEKSPVNETINIEKDYFTSSLKSIDMIKNTEIESNQSLKSNNELNIHCQIVPEPIIIEIIPSNVTEKTVERAERAETVNEIKETPNKINTHIEEKKKEQKIGKSKFLKFLKKNKLKKKSKEDIVDISAQDNTPTITVPPVCNGNISSIPSKKVEIEKEVLQEYNEVLKSLMCNEPETRNDDIVHMNPKSKLNVIASKDEVGDIEDVPKLNNDIDDHLFPDAITVTKIEGCKLQNVPYIDSEISVFDSVSLYNGESKRIRINSDFFVPMASMESLYFPGEILQNDTIQRSLITQSPCKSKGKLGSFFNCMSRKR